MNLRSDPETRRFFIEEFSINHPPALCVRYQSRQMSHNLQSNNHHPIGFSQKNGNPTKGGSLPSEADRRSEGVLSPFEKKTIQCFVEVATGFNLPRFTGEIFGLIYASPEPVTFESVM